jgi:hypothetical protein
MPLGDRVLDNGLSALDTEANRLDVCHTLPTTYAEATSTYTVGNKTNPSIGSPEAASPNGRKVTVAQITDGTITATSTGTSDDAQYWALVDTVNSRLLAAGSLAAGQMVTSGNTFTLAAFDIRIPNQ